MVSIGSLVMHVSDVRRAAEFWIKALGYVPRDGHIDEDWVILVPRHGDGPALALDRSDRMHVDLYADGAQEQQAEVERLMSLGAQQVDWPYPDDAGFVVLADTEGNLFCVVDTAHR
jgi:predicted enzyme related to lactoylglutathione lyase